MKKLFAIVLLVLSGGACAAIGPTLSLDQCKEEAVYGFPTTKKTSTTKVCRIGYVLEHNNIAHIPVWVSYVLTPEHAVGCFPRVSNFVQEPNLPPGASATAKQYAKSGFDIGHLANDADMRWSKLAEAESNIFANAAPQLPEFNRGIWKKLEEATRAWVVSRNHPVLVYIAPTVSPKDPFMKGTDVLVPYGFVKILVDTVTSEVQVFFMENKKSIQPLRTFIISLPEAQERTGVVFPMPKNPKFGYWDLTVKNVRAAKKKTCAIQ